MRGGQGQLNGRDWETKGRKGAWGGGGGTQKALPSAKSAEEVDWLEPTTSPTFPPPRPPPAPSIQAPGGPFGGPFVVSPNSPTRGAAARPHKHKAASANATEWTGFSQRQKSWRNAGTFARSGAAKVRQKSNGESKHNSSRLSMFRFQHPRPNKGPVPLPPDCRSEGLGKFLPAVAHAWIRFDGKIWLGFRPPGVGQEFDILSGEMIKYMYLTQTKNMQTQYGLRRWPMEAIRIGFVIICPTQLNGGEGK